MKKKTLLILLIVLGTAIFFFMLIYMGVIDLYTLGQSNQTIRETSSVYDLTDGCFYVWHNDNTDDIFDDLKGAVDTEVFTLCPAGDINWDTDSFINHTVWFTSTNDSEIPTIYPGDKLLYVSSTLVPYEGIEWERYADYGYTIGVANMIGDNSGHYRIINTDGDGYEGYVYPGSDVNVLNKYVGVSYMFLDKVSGNSIRESSISEGGTVLNLLKDHEYVCEWYTGTNYQDYKMKANIHTFGLLEEFTTYDYEFLHSNCIEIVIPDWFRTGYYYINGSGIFRYVSADDVPYYNGTAYDEEIEWNTRIILYDENGNVIYNPANGLDKRNAEK